MCLTSYIAPYENHTQALPYYIACIFMSLWDSVAVSIWYAKVCLEPERQRYRLPLRNTSWAKESRPTVWTETTSVLASTRTSDSVQEIARRTSDESPKWQSCSPTVESSAWPASSVPTERSDHRCLSFFSLKWVNWNYRLKARMHRIMGLTCGTIEAINLNSKQPMRRPNSAALALLIISWFANDTAAELNVKSKRRHFFYNDCMPGFVFQ